MSLSKANCTKIARLWNLGEVERISLFPDGFQTPKTLVETSKGKFVVSNHILSNRKGLIYKSPRSVEYEIQLLLSLKNLPVPRYLPSSRGTYLERVNKGWITVDEFIPGKPPKRFSPAMLRQLGEFVGEFHKQGESFKKRLRERRRFYDLSPTVIAKMRPFVKRQVNPTLKAVVEEVRLGVERTRPPKNLSKGPVHVDIKPENELWEGGRLSAVLDFGNFYIDALMIDVGKTIMWNCCNNERLDGKLLKAFLQGYESRRALSQQERAYLTNSIRFAVYSHIWVDLYHTPLGYVPEAYTLSLVRNFLPIARSLEAVEPASIYK